MRWQTKQLNWGFPPWRRQQDGSREWRVNDSVFSHSTTTNNAIHDYTFSATFRDTWKISKSREILDDFSLFICFWMPGTAKMNILLWVCNWIPVHEIIIRLIIAYSSSSHCMLSVCCVLLLKFVITVTSKLFVKSVLVRKVPVTFCVFPWIRL